MSNAWIICPTVGNSLMKVRIMPDEQYIAQAEYWKGAKASLKDESASH